MARLDADRYLGLLRERTVVKDGAMGTMVQDGNLSAADYGGHEGNVDHLSLAKPEFIRDIHRSFLDAGADYLITNSFQSTRIRLEEWGLDDATREQNVAAARIAREVADEFATGDWPRFVAGSVGPTGMLPSGNDPTLSAITYPQLVALFREQAGALLEGGVDLLQIETMQDILETRAAVHGARLAFEDAGRRVPLQVSVALDVTGRMLLGTDIAAVAAILRGIRCDVVGTNCSVWTGAPARARPLPHAGVRPAGRRRAQRRPAAERRRRDRLPAGPVRHGRADGRVRARLRRQRRGWLLRHHARAHPPARRGGARLDAAAAPPRVAPGGGQRDGGGGAAPGPAPD